MAHSESVQTRTLTHNSSEGERRDKRCHHSSRAVHSDKTCIDNHVKHIENDTQFDPETLDHFMSELQLLSEEQKELVDTLFNAWDFNKDGLIQIEKLLLHGGTLGGKPCRMFQDFKQMDSDGDGVVTHVGGAPNSCVPSLSASSLSV